MMPTISETIKGFALSFEAGGTCFSPGRIDKGTLAMLSRVTFGTDDKVLDLGCGYGVVGITAAKHMPPGSVFLSDIDEDALKYARRNAIINNVDGIHIISSNAFENIDETGFTIIASNPPYHADFSVPKMFIEKGFNRLTIGGRFYMVTKRKDWYKRKFISVFGGVGIFEIDGYFIFEAEKRTHRYAKGSMQK